MCVCTLLGTAVKAKAKATMKAMETKAKAEPAKAKPKSNMKTMKVKAKAEPAMKAMRAMQAMAMAANEGTELEGNESDKGKDRLWYERNEGKGMSVWFRCVKCGSVWASRLKGEPSDNSWHCGTCGESQSPWFMMA